MPDREKVKAELDEIVEQCRGMDYIGFSTITEHCQNILALLKEREAVKPKSKVRHGANAQIQHFCGNCMKMLHGKPKYCSECGKGVLW